MNLQSRKRRQCAGRMIVVRPVRGRSELSEFVRLPRHFYRSEPGFRPPLDHERHEFLRLDRAPVAQRGTVEYWIAWRNGKAVGRISAQIDPLTLAAWNEPTGMFGCLDAVDDAGVVGELLATASNWLAGQGMKKMRGPFTLSINEEPGLLVEGQAEAPMLLSPWHPAYLAGRMEAAGLRAVKDLLAYSLTLNQTDVQKILRIPDRLIGRFKLRIPDFRRFDEEAEIIRGIFNDAWRNNWGFVPISTDEMSAISKSLRPLILKGSVIIAELDGEPVGFAMWLPNIYDLIDGFDGRLLPLNWVRLAWRLFRKSYRSARILMMGIRSDLQFRPAGSVLPVAMIGEFVKRGRKYHFQDVEMGWVLEDNWRVRSLIEAYGGRVSKRFRLFEGHVGGHG